MLATVLREEDPPLKAIFIQPVVVLVSEDEPELEGSCADFTVLVRDLVARVLADPRPYAKKVPDDAAERASAVPQTHDSRRSRQSNVLGAWELVEEHEAGSTWEVWSARARLGGEGARPMRLKRYRLDPLLTGESRQRQRERARRDLDALQRLNGADGAVPLVSAIEEIDDSFVVVTEWPSGQSLASMLEEGPSDEQDAEEVFEALVAAVASIHRLGVVHRNLSPRCAHFLSSGRVVVTDFDYARLPNTSGSVTEHIADELANDYVAPEVEDGSGAGDEGVGRVVTRANRSRPVRRDWVDRPSRSRRRTVAPGVRACALRRSRESPWRRRAFPGRAEEESSAPPLFDGFEPNDELEERWVVRSEPIGEGGIARVYRVHDTTTQRDYAAKFVRDELAHLIDPVQEYQLLFDVPDHPYLVKPEFPEHMTKFRRAGKQHELRKTFLVTRWVEGTRLDRLLGREARPRPLRRARTRPRRRGRPPSPRTACSTVTSSRTTSSSTGRPATRGSSISTSAARSRPRTEPRSEPRRIVRPTTPKRDGPSAPTSTPSASSSANCSPAACSGRRPATGSTTIPASRRRSHPSSCARRRRDAAGSIPTVGRSSRTALESALVELKRPPGHIDPAPLPVPPADELERPDWNPYQSRLVSLFSQSRTTNAGTRGLDDFARWAYVETLVDRDLFPDIVWGKYGLVVITGNAGDGKTAFIQMLEQRLEGEGADVTRRPGGNGSTIVRHEHRFVTNWDGSQDEGEYENDAVLLDFFAPFAGERPDRPPAETRVIAINEGRLLDFVGATQGRVSLAQRSRSRALHGAAPSGRRLAVRRQSQPARTDARR